MNAPTVAGRRVQWFRVLCTVVVATGIILGVASAQPLSSAWDGATLCFPVLGPVERFDPALSDSALQRVQAHEDVHRMDCLKQGAVINFLRLATTKGRLDAEARAGCAEARQQVGLGRDPWLEHERLVDELHYGYPWFRRLPESALRHALREVCPDIASAGAKPPWSRGNP